jgi:hypothetical protein
MPASSPSTAAAVAAADLSRVAFGSRAAHLDVDLDGLRRPQAVSAVLLACMPERTADEVWGWTLDGRMQALIAVVIDSDGAQLPAVVRCPAPECGEPIGLEIDLVQFFAAPALESSPSGRCDGAPAAVRAPTGSDQLAWQAMPGQAPDLAARIAATLLCDERDRTVPLDAAALTRIGDALAALDPLTALQIEVDCPACARVASIDFDLEGCLLARLRRARRVLLEEVHRLARTYHWSEDAILALPRGRRSAYLSRIAAEMSG